MAVYIYRIKGASRTTFGEFDGIEDLKAYIHNYNDESVEAIGLSNTHFVWDCDLHNCVNGKTESNKHNTAIYNGLKAALERGFLSEKEFKENAECLEVKNGK